MDASASDTDAQLAKLLPVDDEVNAIAAVLPWTVRSSYKFKHVAHVNLQETRALKKDLRELVSAELIDGRRQVVLCDSQVAVAVWTRGRSSSYKLNGILRSSIGYLVCGGVSLMFVAFAVALAF